MDAFLEQLKIETKRRLIEQIDAEGGPTYEEVMASWQEWRERQKAKRKAPEKSGDLPKR